MKIQIKPKIKTRDGFSKDINVNINENKFIPDILKHISPYQKMIRVKRIFPTDCNEELFMDENETINSRLDKVKIILIYKEV